MATLNLPSPPRLPDPPPRYDPRDQAEMRAALDRWMQEVTAWMQQVQDALP